MKLQRSSSSSSSSLPSSSSPSSIMPPFNGNQEKRSKPSSSSSSHFSINDQPDILVEVLKRLDGRSLAVASCVCRLWYSIPKSDDTVWEYVCFRHVSSAPPPPTARPLVRALGGYKRLYMVCVRPALRRLLHHRTTTNNNHKSSLLSRRALTRQGAQLLLSLFCVDYYENLGPNITNTHINTINNNNTNTNNNNNNNNNGGATIGSDAASSSLMFLCKPVNV